MVAVAVGHQGLGRIVQWLRGKLHQGTCVQLKTYRTLYRHYK